MDEDDLDTEDDDPSQRYDVVITGMRSGVERGAFLANLSAHLKASTATLEPLFSPTGLVVKRSSDYATASKYVSALREWNCVCKLVRSNAPPAPPKFPPAAPKPVVEAPPATPKKAYTPGWIAFTLVMTLAISFFRLHEIKLRLGGSASEAGASVDATDATANSASDGATATSALEVEIVKSAGFAHDAMSEHVTAAAALAEGGFLVATAVQPAGTFLYLISKDGEVLWRDDLSASGEHLTSAGSAPEGGYWIAGQVPDATGNSRDFTQRVSAEGKLAAPVVLSSISDNRLSHCMTDNGSGFVQISSNDTLDEYFRLPTPAVSMTNDSGDRIWEHLIATVQGQRIATSVSGPQSTDASTCAGITSDAAGRILAAQRIVLLPDASSKEDMDKQLASATSYGTLLVALDAKGTEIASIRHDNTVGAIMIGTPKGAVLFESAAPRKGPIAASTTDLINAVKAPEQGDARLHMYTFDYALKETRPQVVFAGTQLDSVDAALLTPEGGLLITGCPGDGGSRYVLYIDALGTMSPKRKFAQLGEDCHGLYRLSKADSPGEALLLSQTPDAGNRLFTIRYLN